MFLGSKLRDLREANELTQTELSKRLGITQGSLGHFEKNRREPSKELVLKLCDIFNVQESYFYDGQEVDKVRELIDDLKRQHIIQDADDIKDDVAELILGAVKTELRLNKLKKEQGK